ncbi:MAG: DUF1801 domain-containing protein [Myxococcota bacterium]|nr:DUF1801 domain-containing protein [Myxococcota bacterium]
MVTSAVQDYMDSLDDSRRAAVSELRQTILANLPEGYEEGIQHGIISYYVPHSICPDGYHSDPKQPVPFAGLSGKGKKISLHLFCLYVDPAAKERFVTAWKKGGRKLDMGASCVRFTKLEDVPLEVIGEAIASLPVADFLETYEATVPMSARKKRSWGKPA